MEKLTCALIQEAYHTIKYTRAILVLFIMTGGPQQLCRAIILSPS
jgi:hypothetical protein